MRQGQLLSSANDFYPDCSDRWACPPQHSLPFKAKLVPGENGA